MESRLAVLFIGDSVLLESVALCLMERPMLDVTWINPQSTDIKQSVMNIKPDLILFELDAPCTQSIISLLRDQPGTLLLGIDLACSRVIVINSHQCDTHTMRDLNRVFQSEVDRIIKSSNGGTMSGQNKRSDTG